MLQNVTAESFFLHSGYNLVGEDPPVAADDPGLALLEDPSIERIQLCAWETFYVRGGHNSPP